MKHLYSRIYFEYKNVIVILHWTFILEISPIFAFCSLDLVNYRFLYRIQFQGNIILFICTLDKKRTVPFYPDEYSTFTHAICALVNETWAFFFQIIQWRVEISHPIFWNFETVLHEIEISMLMIESVLLGFFSSLFDSIFRPMMIKLHWYKMTMKKWFNSKIIFHHPGKMIHSSSSSHRRSI